jgi:hypothetical protein
MVNIPASAVANQGQVLQGKGSSQNAVRGHCPGAAGGSAAQSGHAAAAAHAGKLQGRVTMLVNYSFVGSTENRLP